MTTGLRQRLVDAFRHFVYGSWWVASGAAALTLLSWFDLGCTTALWPMLIFVLGATVIVYNLNMLSGLRELRRSATSSLRHRWCIANEEAMKAHLGAGALLAVPSFFLLDRSIWLVLVPTAVAALLYVLPVIKGIKLREFGLWKIFIIATVWTVVTVGLPAVQMRQGTEWPTIVLMMAGRWLFIFAITVPFDIRDLAPDADKQVRTLPSVLGWRHARLVAVAALLAHMTLVLVRLTPAEAVGEMFGALVALLLILASRPGRSDMFFSFWLEGTMMLLAGAALLLRHL